MLARGSSDIVVTAAKAAELSRPAKAVKGKKETGAVARDAQAVDPESTGSVKRKAWRRRP